MGKKKEESNYIYIDGLGRVLQVTGDPGQVGRAEWWGQQTRL